jgi:hypothetical protein
MPGKWSSLASGIQELEEEKGTRLVQIWVGERDVVVASDAVAEGREALVDPLDDHLFRQAVLQVLELCGH